MAEMTKEEIALEDEKTREAIRSEVFEGTPPEITAGETNEDQDETPGTTPVQADNGDPYAGLDPKLVEFMNGINSKLSLLPTLEERLKQSEKRLGGVINEIHNAKKAADDAEANKKAAPTDAEIEMARKSEKSWEDLKDEFPDWAIAIKGRIAADMKNVVSVDMLTEKLESLRKENQTSKQSGGIDPNFELRLLKIIHPDYHETYKSPEFQEWKKRQSFEIQRQADYGETADDGISVLNLFKNDPGTSKKDLTNKRLAASVTTQRNHKTIKPKSISDMTEAELRRDVENEVFGGK